MSVAITIGQLEDLAFEDSLLTPEGVELRVIKKGNWSHEHKFQSREIIFTDGERYYRGSIERSGSEWTDWAYGSEYYGDGPAGIERVRLVQHVREVWTTDFSQPVIDYDLLAAAAREFIRKCDCGQAKSKRSYAQFKAALGEQVEEAI
ncbi:hypothetical protein EV294_112105 [Paenibacillus sp. BK033]|uniref:hypothetical protein n=1 Tax=Paenibacillus sp. BK033 TaxID=2512133 RepID=UPI00104935AE|nr:hypothetical protein [Paenibacillus sp. BK033]TCM89640.1 hypothetical protein EV294_112105 [Paenibacillus sp. BK033]